MADDFDMLAGCSGCGVGASLSCGLMQGRDGVSHGGTNGGHPCIVAPPPPLHSAAPAGPSVDSVSAGMREAGTGDPSLMAEALLISI